MSTKNLSFVIEAQLEAKKEMEQMKNSLGEIESKLTSVSGASQSAGIGFGKMFGAVALGELAADGIKKLASAALDFVGASLEIAAQRETTALAFETMIGNAEVAQKTLEELHAFARQTPFTITGIDDASRMLLAMGITAGELMPTIKSLGDVAAGLSVPIEQIALAYGQVRAANQLYGTELRQFIQAGVPLLAQLATQFNVTEGEVREMVEEGKVGFKEVEQAFKSMSGEGGRFEDLMVKMSQTVTGKWSNIRDSSDRVAEGFGKVLTPATKILEDRILDLLDGMNSVIFTADGGLSPEAQELADNFEDLAKVTFEGGDAMGFMTSFAINLADALVQVGKGAAYAVISMKNFLDMTVGTVGTGIGASWEAITNENVSWKSALSATMDSFKGDVTDMEDAYNTLFTTVEGGGDVLKKMNEQMASVSTPSFGGGGGGSSEASREAQKELREYQRAVENVGETYVDLEEAAVDALDSVHASAEKALGKLDDRIADIRLEIAGLTEEFQAATEGSKTDIAEEYVAQEQKVKDLQEALSELRAEQDADPKDVTALEEELLRETQALEAFSGRAIELATEIEEARRRAGLTDFARTIEDIDAEQAAREAEFNEKIQMLADEYTAIEAQKAQIVRIEQETTTTINNLRQTAANMYEQLMAGLAESTTEYVDQVIAALEALNEAMGVSADIDIAASAAQAVEVAGAVPTTSSTESNQSNTGTTNYTFNVNVTATGSQDGTSLAQTIIDEITRQVQLISLGSS